MTTPDHAVELATILENPETAENIHLSSKATAMNYLRFADEVAQHLSPNAALLDWGCGRGQMSWLLHRRQLAVTSYDIRDNRHGRFLLPNVAFIEATHPTQLPWPDATFAGVLSCGVLEHVPDDRAALDEIFRVLQPGGYLFIYQLPQVYAYTEFINRLRGVWYHDRRYTLRATSRMLQTAGFSITTARRHNFFPKNLTGLPARIRHFYNQQAPYFATVEKVVVHVPMLNWLCHSLEFIVQKPQG